MSGALQDIVMPLASRTTGAAATKEAAVLHAIKCSKRLSSASKHLIQEYAESCLGAPEGYLDAKKAAIDDLWREAQSG